MARDANVAPKLTWRAGPTWMRRGIEATWQGRTWPTRGVGSVDTRQEAMRTPARGAMWQGGWKVKGPGKYIGAVTQMLTAPLPFIVVISIYFVRVRLCSRRFFFCR